jgi:geranylgeranyl pyrophosphate synthase
MLFQLADDCLDYEASSEVLKKKANHDLTEGVVTLPLIYSFLKSPALRERVNQWNMSPADVRDVVSEVIRLGGLDQSKQLADRYYERARKRITRLADPARGQRILGLLEKIKQRSH